MAFKVGKVKAIDTSSLDKLGKSTVDLAKYTEDEFAQVASALQGDDPFTINYKAPAKPRTGLLMYADGTHWNPGEWEGFYSYSSGGVWVPCSISSSSAVVSLGGVKGVITLGDGLEMVGQQLTMKTRTRTVLTNGSGTYTPPSGCQAINVRMVGGGGGGAGGDTGGGAGGLGTNTTFGTLSAGRGGNGGTFGNANAAGGTSLGGDLNMQGGHGGAWGPGVSSPIIQGAKGGDSVFCGGGFGGWPGAAGTAGATNSGGGGGGGGAGTSGHGGNSGAAGGYCEKLITSLAANYAYVVGTGGAAGTGGSTSAAGGAGAAGIIIVDEFYQ